MKHRIYYDHNGNQRLGDIQIFLEIALENSLQAKKYGYEREQLLQSEEKIYNQIEEQISILKGFNYWDRLFQIQDKRIKHQTIGIISLVTFYEALINEVGITELGKKYFDEHLDRLSHLSKWEVVLKLVYGKTINKDNKYFEHLNKLIKTRNSLIHYKTKQGGFPTKTQEKKDQNLRILLNALRSVPVIFEQLSELDMEKGILKFLISKEVLAFIRKI